MVFSAASNLGGGVSPLQTSAGGGKKNKGKRHADNKPFVGKSADVLQNFPTVRTGGVTYTGSRDSVAGSVAKVGVAALDVALGGVALGGVASYVPPPADKPISHARRQQRSVNGPTGEDDGTKGVPASTVCTPALFTDMDEPAFRGHTVATGVVSRGRGARSIRGAHVVSGGVTSASGGVASTAGGVSSKGLIDVADSTPRPPPASMTSTGALPIASAGALPIASAGALPIASAGALPVLPTSPHRVGRGRGRGRGGIV